MNLKEIKDIIKLMNDNDLKEIEVEREGAKIKLKKASNEGEVSFQAPAPYHPPPPVPQPGNQPVADSSPVAKSNLKEIKSPMVGTFYRAPAPESPAFIEIGQIVEVGQVVCIVEAMKLMNEIKSEVKGKVVEIPVENAQPVEFGQVIVGVEPV